MDDKHNENDDNDIDDTIDVMEMIEMLPEQFLSLFHLFFRLFPS